MNWTTRRKEEKERSWGIGMKRDQTETSDERLWYSRRGGKNMYFEERSRVSSNQIGWKREKNFKVFAKKDSFKLISRELRILSDWRNQFENQWCEN